MDEEIIQTAILIIAAVLIYVLARRLKFKNDKTLKVNYKYEFSKLLFIVYIVGLLGVLLIPVIRMGYSNNNGFYCHIVTYDWDYNLVPFRTISEQFQLLTGGSKDESRNGLLNLFVNSCLFIPFPAIIKFAFQKLKTVYCFLIPFASIILCEFLQYIPGRRSDIDDVILNTIGLLVGMIILQLVQNKNFFKTQSEN